MKTRLFRILVLCCISTFLLLGGCNKFKVSKETKASTVNESLQDLGNDRLQLTVPSSYEAIRTPEQCEEVVKSRGYESGSYDAEKHTVTYVMTKDQFHKLTFELYSYIAYNTKMLNKSDSYANVRDVKYNEDYTDVTIYTKSQRIGTIERHLFQYFFDYGKMYNTYWGKPDTRIHVRFVNFESGKVLEEEYSN